MKKSTKTTKKSVKKSSKPVAKATAAPKVEEMKFKTVETLANHIARRLPWARQTEKIRDLRNIKLDPASLGNGLIIWYGCRSSMNIIDFHVDRNLSVSYKGMDLSKADADILIAEISKLLKGNCYNAKANVMLMGNCFVPTLPSLPQVKSEIALVPTSEVVITPAGCAVLAAPAEAISQQLENIEGANAAAAIVAGN